MDPANISLSNLGNKPSSGQMGEKTLTVIMNAYDIDGNRGPCRDWYVDRMPLMVRRRKDGVPDRNLGDSDGLQTIESSISDPRTRTH
jgi:hypothetical protein